MYSITRWNKVDNKALQDVKHVINTSLIFQGKNKQAVLEVGSLSYFVPEVKDGSYRKSLVKLK